MRSRCHVSIGMVFQRWVWNVLFYWVWNAGVYAASGLIVLQQHGRRDLDVAVGDASLVVGRTGAAAQWKLPSLQWKTG